jgi:hypothetical protein
MRKSPSQDAFTQQQAWDKILRQQQIQAEGWAQAQQERLRYLEVAGFPSSALQEAVNGLTQALQNAANAAWRAGDLPAYWRRQEEIAGETQRAARREQESERQDIQGRTAESRAKLEYAEAARLPKELRDSLRQELVQVLQEAAEVALLQGKTNLFWQREADIARLQERRDPFAALTQRIIGGPSGREEAFAPLEMLKGMRDAGAQSFEPLRQRDSRLIIQIELTEGLKAKVVDQSSLASLQLITRIVEGMG